MLRIGLAGIGFMGMIHYLAAKRLHGAKVRAIATRDERKRAGDWTMIQGNFGPRGGHEDLSQVQVYTSIEEMVADADLDLIDICLPNHQHADAAIVALRAGKHVLVEKAIALSLHDADRMIDAARAAGKLLMVAHVLPYMGEFQFALELVKSNKYGKLQAAHFRRHISPPDWSAAMRDFQSTGGGPIVDLHIHDTHYVALLCGVPKQVYTRGLARGGAAEYVTTQYLFDENTPVVSATSGAISHAARPFTHGFEIYLEQATLYFELGGKLTLYSAEGMSHPEVPATDPVEAFTAEIQSAVDAVAGPQPATILDAHLARGALALCLKEQESLLTGQIVTV